MPFPALESDPVAHINMYRRSVELHSIIYYAYDTNVVSDLEFDNMCKRLVELQKKYPKESKSRKSYKPKLFKGFTGGTGMHLTADLDKHYLAQRIIHQNEKRLNSA